MSVLTQVRDAAFTVVAGGVIAAALAVPMLSAKRVSERSAAAAEAALTAPADAAVLYQRAAAGITAHSPSASNLEYPEFPPMGDAWMRLAEAAWAENGLARQLARDARSARTADWPEAGTPGYLNDCRTVANDLGDAALYQHLLGNDAQALEIIHDLFALAHWLTHEPRPNDLVHPLVSAGIESVALARLGIISSGLKLTNDPADVQRFAVAKARALIARLLDQQDPLERLKVSLGPEAQALAADLERDNDKATLALRRFVETVRRVDAERSLMAMSLACRLYEFEMRRWPERLEEITPQYLPRVPIDPWGDGKQTFGYALIRGGLPDGSDRPLVYSRLRSRDGLLYRTDQPTYATYLLDGSDLPVSRQKQGGQFRDVTRWVPVAANKQPPTVRPLE